MYYRKTKLKVNKHSIQLAVLEKTSDGKQYNLFLLWLYTTLKLMTLVNAVVDTWIQKENSSIVEMKHTPALQTSVSEKCIVSN